MRTGKWFYLLFLLIGSLTAVNAQSESKLTERLQTSITQKGEEAEVRAWIFFNDKGPTIEAKLREAEANLTPRALRRRLRNRGKNNLVDFKDIPVNPAYISRIRPNVNKIRHKSRWLNAVSVQASGRALRQLEAKPFIKKIDIVVSARLPQPQPESTAPFPPTESIGTLLDYGASYNQNNQINTIPLHDMGYDGSGVVVCMLDAGFNNLTHEALDHLNILHTWDFVNGDSIVWDEPGQAGTGNHGTYTLSTLGGFEPGQLVGPAFGASFLLGKTENTDWERHVEEDDWVAGAEWADSLGADVISSSLGYRDFDPGEGSYTSQDMDGNTAISTIGADIAASRGILVVTSAGNEGPASPPENSIVAPTDGDSVLSIGAVDGSGTRAGFSSMGPTADGRIKPNVMARGVSTYCALPSGPSSYGGVSGTSLSCPLVAGAAALVMQVNPHLTNMQVYRALELTASNAASPNNSYGWGIINTFDAAFYYTPQIVHTPLPDTEELTGPYPVQAEIISNFSLIGDSIRVYYRIGAGAFQSV
ncbi:MAG: S8 family serine peptidase, partial [Calditrichia bacterium]